MQPNKNTLTRNKIISLSKFSLKNQRVIRKLRLNFPYIMCTEYADDFPLIEIALLLINLIPSDYDQWQYNKYEIKLYIKLKNV